MEIKSAIASLSALAHEGRLAAFRILVQAGPDGIAAGEIARRLDAPPNTLSANLKVLTHAGLLTSRREGRSIIYSAIFPALSDLVAFLMRDCCEGHCAVCDKAIALFAKCTGRPAHSVD